MNRYNQGFKKFGPMEQCDIGDWVKYQDHEKELRKLAHVNSQLVINEAEYISKINSQRNSIDSLKETILGYKKIICSLFGLICILVTYLIVISN